MSDPEIMVCIPTFRRPLQLAALLQALGHQTPQSQFGVLIGNNDALSVLPLIRANLPTHIPVDEIIVAERGVVAVRNAMIDRILVRGTSADWIACLDDDQVPSPDWLNQILAVGRRYQADIVGGPVHQIPEIATFWSGAATSTEYLPSVEGTVRLLNEAGNMLLLASFLRGVTQPIFSPEFGRSGGEDYEFFLRSCALDAKICWAPSACVTEVIPASRLTLAGLVWRAYSTAAYQIRAERLHSLTINSIRRLGWDIIILLPAVLRTAIRYRSFKIGIAMFVKRAAGVAGKIAGFVGLQLERYGTT